MLNYRSTQTDKIVNGIENIIVDLQEIKNHLQEMHQLKKV
jgi:hypothetical protein